MMTTMAEILLVDDNPADLDLTIDALAQSPWRTHVSTVSDGAEAIAYLYREGKYAGGHSSPPGSAGPEFAPQGRTFRPGRHEIETRPAPDSGRDFQHVRKPERTSSSSYELGANSYVSKPPTLSEWVSAVKVLNEFWIGCACLPREVEP